MINAEHVEIIVTQSAARVGLDQTQWNDLLRWMERWMSAFTTEREYTAQAVRTMSQNAAVHYKSQL